MKLVINMATSRTTPSQFEIMMDFMERHGDIGKPAEIHKRLEYLQRWIELTDLLNAHSSSGESVKPVEKWRKVWSDLKNNTKKKVAKTRKHGSKVAPMSDIEKRMIKFMGYNLAKMRKVSLESDSILIKSEEEEEDETLQQSDSPPLRYFYIVDNDSKTQDSASSSTPSASSPQPTPAKRRKSNDNEDMIESKKRVNSNDNEDITVSEKRIISNDNEDIIVREKIINSNDNEDMTDIDKRRKLSDNKDLKEIAHKFLEFEKEKDRRSHETEMVRLKQNDRLISVVGRIVNVLETLTPCFQRYLSKNLNDGG